MKRSHTWVFLVILFSPWVWASNTDPVIKSVVQRLKQDVPLMQEYGAYQRIVTTKLADNGKPKRIEEKQLRTVWIQNKTKNQIVNVRCEEIDLKSGERERCLDIYRIKYPPKNSQPGRIESEIKKVHWTEIHKNFVFSTVGEDGPYHVISFRPRPNTSPSNRIEKLISRMAGKIWVDRQFNIVKAEANLTETVSFGLGIAAKVHHLAIRYTQQQYRSVWLPSSLTVDFNARVALVHTERQRIEVVWDAPYRKSEAIWAHASSEERLTTRK